ncbi:g8047 [Coccomyxa elongata]
MLGSLQLSKTHPTISRALHCFKQPGIPRRKLLLDASVLPVVMGILGNPSPARQASRLVQSGMDKFRRADVEGSLEDFNRALSLDPAIRPYLWQRGLSLFYAEQYEEASRQFRDDVAVNPNDTEEAIWAFLAEAQLIGHEKARQDILKVGEDPRPVMRAAYTAFQDGKEPDRIMAAINPVRGSHDTFYAQLYTGLYYESLGDASRAEEAMLAAVQSPYAQQSGDYMSGVAAVHCLTRGFKNKESS